MSLSYNLPRGHVVARNREYGAILIGGLGGLGVGQSWKPETEDDRTREGYADAPYQEMHSNDIAKVIEWRRVLNEQGIR